MPVGNSILHVDMDAFYASVEQRDCPELLGKPVIVGGRPESRGVVAACSYEARKFGIHSAMPCAQALKLCPTAIFIPPRMVRYREVSAQVIDILESFTPIIQKISIDEAFLDVSGTRRLYPDATALARELKRVIREKLRLNASVGVARNKFLAKLASDLEKPNGLTVVPERDGELLQFLAPLPVGSIWGVGDVLKSRLHNAGIRTFGDIQKLSKSEVLRIPGNSMGEMLWCLAHGIDTREVEVDRAGKSISSESTFTNDLFDRQEIQSVIVRQAEDAARRLRASGQYASTVQIKIRFTNFKTITRQVSVAPATCSDGDIIREAIGLLKNVKLEQGVRLTGVGVAKLTDDAGASSDVQLSLFGDNVGDAKADQGKLDAAVDVLREKYGKDSLKRGERTRD